MHDVGGGFGSRSTPSGARIYVGRHRESVAALPHPCVARTSDHPLPVPRRTTMKGPFAVLALSTLIAGFGSGTLAAQTEPSATRA